jgi:hypothetical protein
MVVVVVGEIVGVNVLVVWHWITFSGTWLLILQLFELSQHTALNEAVTTEVMGMVSE